MRHRGEDRIEAAFCARIEDMELEPEGSGRGPAFPAKPIPQAIGRVEKQADDGRRMREWLPSACC